MWGFSDAFVREVGEYNYNCAVKSGEDPFGKPKEFLKFTVEKGAVLRASRESREPLDARRRAC